MASKKSGFFTRGMEKNEKWHDHLRKNTPTSYWMLVMTYLICLTGLLFIVYSYYKPVPVEIEANCNTGFIGVDFKGYWRNEPHQMILAGWGESVKYRQTFLPTQFDLKNIDGMNCHWKFKGAFSEQLLIALVNN